jgi:hypothetical protein
MWLISNKHQINQGLSHTNAITCTQSNEFKNVIYGILITHEKEGELKNKHTQEQHWQKKEDC